MYAKDTRPWVKLLRSIALNVVSARCSPTQAPVKKMNTKGTRALLVLVTLTRTGWDGKPQQKLARQWGFLNGDPVRTGWPNFWQSIIYKIRNRPRKRVGYIKHNPRKVIIFRFNMRERKSLWSLDTRFFKASQKLKMQERDPERYAHSWERGWQSFKKNWLMARHTKVWQLSTLDTRTTVHHITM